MARILLGVCGGIAAYKVVELARELTRAGADVRVVMTEAATNFVGPITFSTLTQNPVATDLFPHPPPPEIPHTALARWAEVVVVAPATATILAKYTYGLADDLLSAILLATKAPVVMAPAMHAEMWENEATVRNVETLRARGVCFVDPEEGELAGGDVGVGRLAEIPRILEAVTDEISRLGDLAGVPIVVTAGPTQEPIDPIRFIANRSSGRMGYELAAEAARRGAKVTLVTGPSALSAPAAAEVVRVSTTHEMKEAVLRAAENARVVVMAAAVSDFRARTVSPKKLKKAAGPPRIDLEPTDDILAELGRARPKGAGASNGIVLVGFAAETEELEENGRRELEEKGSDLVVANLVGVDYSGFEAETNLAVMIDRTGRVDRLELMTKRELARVVFDAVSERFL